MADTFGGVKFKPNQLKKTPTIIMFEEPGKCNDNRARKLVKINTGNENSEFDFVNVAREIKQFGMTGFKRIDQKKQQQKYVESLGAYKRKNQKMPYPLLMQHAKAKRKKEEKQKDLERAMGIFKKRKLEEKVNVQNKYNLGRWVDKSKINRNTKSNSITVNKKEIAKLSRKK